MHNFAIQAKTAHSQLSETNETPFTRHDKHILKVSSKNIYQNWSYEQFKILQDFHITVVRSNFCFLECSKLWYHDSFISKVETNLFVVKVQSILDIREQSTLNGERCSTFCSLLYTLLGGPDSRELAIIIDPLHRKSDFFRWLILIVFLLFRQHKQQRILWLTQPSYSFRQYLPRTFYRIKKH